MSYDTEWHYVGESGEPEFENGASTWGSNSLRFMKGADGVIRIEGTASIFPESYFGKACFTLPIGYRPIEGNLKLPCFHGNSASYINIKNNGKVEPYWLNAEINASFFIGPVILGEQGEAGETGPGFETYDSEKEYNQHDLIASMGIAYLSTENNNKGHTPGTDEYWKEAFKISSVYDVISGGNASTGTLNNIISGGSAWAV